MGNVLIIDDDEMFCEMLSDMVQDMGYGVKYARTLDEGLHEAGSGNFDVVFLDVRMPDGSGLEVLPRFRELPTSPEVIIITGAGDPDGAELAILNGAWDYIEKQSSIKKMTLALSRALQYRQEKKSKTPMVALKLEGIVGKSPQMRACYDVLAQAAETDANVMIVGETGTGKELFARAIHANSSRANKPFVVVDCAAMPESLVESALFGYEKGAFTGADRPQVGLIKQADGGTLFLDEVGELPLIMQKAFLRVLQERRFRPLGARQEVESNFRLVVASNRDFEQLVAEGLFRKDLLFRLRSITIELPPLRERPEDIRDLVMFHLAKLCESYDIGPKGFAPEFLDCLMAYDWPGNVRELVNTLERALAAARHEPTLYPSHLPSHIRIKVARGAVSKESHEPDEPPRVAALPKLKDFREAAIARAEKQYLQDLMALTDNDIKEACRVSALSMPRLYALLKKHRINRGTYAAIEKE
ncbi:MAG: sigma-54 dependent transcriptional regulator [Deltaproteobacteria bacterium]|nr:sigma-54 dependent transcriptional regulator [Deltaproteobacteria bacterium]